MRLGDVKRNPCTFVKKFNFGDERNLIYLFVWEIKKKDFGGVIYMYLIFVLEIGNG